MKDVLGNDLVPGDRVGCAFSYSQASVGTIRLGEIVEVDNSKVDRWGRTYTQVKCKWNDSDKVSPWMKYGGPDRWVKV